MQPPGNRSGGVKSVAKEEESISHNQKALRRKASLAIKDLAGVMTYRKRLKARGERPREG